MCWHRCCATRSAREDAKHESEVREKEAMCPTCPASGGLKRPRNIGPTLKEVLWRCTAQIAQ
jgi:hypothetical protein